MAVLQRQLVQKEEEAPSCRKAKHMAKHWNYHTTRLFFFTTNHDAHRSVVLLFRLTQKTKNLKKNTKNLFFYNVR